jgi:nucleotide-binding universal stress UspA family protein
LLAVFALKQETGSIYQFVESAKAMFGATLPVKDLVDPPAVIRGKTKPQRGEAGFNAPQFNRILVPIDFSRPSLKAIPYALAISRQFGADVHLLHVTDLAQQPAPTLLTLPLVPQPEWDQRLMKRLEALVVKYRTDGKVSALEPRTGTAYEEICDAARELKADLIVVATHGYTGYKRMFLGSVAERIVQHSPCPVLIVRHHYQGWNGIGDLRTRTGFKLGKILVPTDFSDCSQAAFEYGVQLAREFGAELRLVHVINPQAFPFGDKYTALDPAELLAQMENAAKKSMRSIAAKAKSRYSVQLIHGSPAIEICKAANEDVDLIVICTHGRTGLGHLLIGSVAEHVVRYAHCPVLVIPSRTILQLAKERDQP